jgi:hypothetical protein
MILMIVVGLLNLLMVSKNAKTIILNHPMITLILSLYVTHKSI